MSMPLTPERLAARRQRTRDLEEVHGLVGSGDADRYPDEGYRIEVAVLLCRDNNLRVPKRLRDVVVGAYASYFEVSHEDDDDFYLDALDPWMPGSGF